MKFYYLFTAIVLAGMAACSGGEKEKADGEETVETTLLAEPNEVGVMELKSTDFMHELISNGKLSARSYVDLTFHSAEPIAHIYVKNGDRVKKGQKLAEKATLRTVQLSNTAWHVPAKSLPVLSRCASGM